MKWHRNARVTYCLISRKMWNFSSCVCARQEKRNWRAILWHDILKLYRYYAAGCSVVLLLQSLAACCTGIRFSFWYFVCCFLPLLFLPFSSSCFAAFRFVYLYVIKCCLAHWSLLYHPFHMLYIEPSFFLVRSLSCAYCSDARKSI